MSESQVRRLVELDTRFQVHALLKEHHVPLQYTAKDLEEAAERFAAAGVTSNADEALAALKRRKPARAPIYLDGDSYALDPHDDEVDVWLFRLGLRPARSTPLRAVPNKCAQSREQKIADFSRELDDYGGSKNRRLPEKKFDHASPDFTYTWRLR